MSQAHEPNPNDLYAVDRAERARRVKEMLARWTTESVAEEPDWDVDKVDRIAMRPSPDPSHRK